MFKKFNGFDSRFKKNGKEKKTPDKTLNNKITDAEGPKRTIVWPEIDKEDYEDNKEDSRKAHKKNIKKDAAGFNKKDIRSIKHIKKKYAFPDFPRRIDSHSFINRIIDYFHNKFRIHRQGLLGIFFGLVIAVFIIFIITLISDYGKVRGLADYQSDITTNIYDKNGLLISELFKQKREVVPLNKIPKDLVNAFVAIEDNDFYKHFGINVKGIVRAFFVNIFSGQIKQGGSTITQQLSKNLLTSRERNIFRKIKEATISLMIEAMYTKDEILGLYLNQIFLGHGVYGVESASKFYFSKHVWDLNLAESALLATLPSAPNKLSPIRHTEVSIEKHRIILARMADCGFITIPQAEKAYLEFWPDYLVYINELPPTMTSWSHRVDRAPWFTEYMRRKLVKQFGEETVYRDGLSVYTTLDLKKQLAAQKVLEKALEKQNSVSATKSFKSEDYVIENYSEITDLLALMFDINPYYKKGSLQVKQVNDYVQAEVLDELDTLSYFFSNDDISGMLVSYRDKQSGDKGTQKVEGCLVSIDQRTGYIEAMVGGSEFSSINQLNRVMQSRRQPGSAIKGLLYSAAMESKKFTPASTVLDSPLLYLDAEGLDWAPENYEERYYGLVRLRTAIEKSINIISVKIAEGVGIGYIQEYLARLLKFNKDEIKQRIPRNLSIALGSFEVTPYELARAYAIIANGGSDVIPVSVRYVKNRNGEVIDNPEQQAKDSLKKEADKGVSQIIKADTAQIMISMLRSVMTSGTGLSASIGRPSCGKTGTTSNSKDAWFVGFTPQLTTCVWVGYDNAGLSLGMGQTGGVVSAPIWGDYMREALSDEPVLEFPHYATLISRQVCAVSGLLPSSSCRKVIDEVFIEDTVPVAECEMCKDMKYDIDPNITAPKENISGSQKDSILENIKSKKDNSSILKDIGKDLLD